MSSRKKKTVIASACILFAIVVVFVCVYFVSVRSKHYDIEYNSDFEYAEISAVLEGAEKVLGNTYENMTLPDKLNIAQGEKLYVISACALGDADSKNNIKKLCKTVAGVEPDTLTPAVSDPEDYDAEAVNDFAPWSFSYYDNNSFNFYYINADLDNTTYSYEKSHRVAMEDISGVSYKLFGEEYSIEQAVKFTENYIRNNLSEFMPDTDDVRAQEVFVFKNGDGYDYSILLQHMVDGFPISTTGAVALDSGYMRGQLLQVKIARPDIINTLSNRLYCKFKEKKEVDEIITLESALDYLEGYLAPNSQYEISEITLEYCAKCDDYNDYDFEYRPTWCFTIGEYQGDIATLRPKKMLYVDAVSGEVYCYDSELNTFIF